MNKNTSQHYRLGQLLLSRHLINQDQLEQALEYQRHSGCKLGEALVELRFISNAQLTQALDKQSHLRAWAACLALLAPTSFCYSYDPLEHEWTSHIISEEEQWPQLEALNLNQIKPSMYGQAISAAWSLYQGLPEQGKWQYSFGKTTDQTGYQVRIQLSF